MNQDLFILGGYGQYIWPAFLFTFLSCFSLYLITKKELKKQEKIFLKEFKEFKSTEIKIAKQKEAAIQSLSIS